MAVPSLRFQIGCSRTILIADGRWSTRTAPRDTGQKADGQDSSDISQILTEIVSLSQILVQLAHINCLPSPLPGRLADHRRQRSGRAQQQVPLGSGQLISHAEPETPLGHRLVGTRDLRRNVPPQLDLEFPPWWVSIIPSRGGSFHEQDSTTVLGSISVDGRPFPHAWVQVALDDGNFMILDHDFDSDEPIDVDYEASLILNWEHAQNLSTDSVETILARSFAWGWRPPRIRPPRIRVPDIRIPGVPNPIEAAKRDLQNKATQLAASYKSSNPNADQDDCVAVVAAGLAAYGAAKGSSGGPWGAAFGAAIGAGGGVPLARIACRRIFP